ncbi:MAG: cell envelope integrity protein CreD [Desulfobacterales bacterium]|nr:cell envelope integrity protein CreD [Desulfobacterales bacterium]MBF0398027.1 cell envelope integrity protein CreD [Desulfobacterales bacterium]
MKEELTIKFNKSMKAYPTVYKLLGILFLVICLLIPLEMISSVLFERLSSRNQAIEDITSSWGKEQNIIGPILVVPYRACHKVWKEEITNGKLEKREVAESFTANALFLPSILNILGSINPNKLHRGIYEAVVYSGMIKISGQFEKPNFEIFKVEEKNILWDDAFITLGVTDLRGTKGSIHIKWGEDRFMFVTGSKIDDLNSGIQAKIKGLNAVNQEIPFEIDLKLNGSKQINFAPIGIQNNVKIVSPWTDPSFKGNFLPTERKIAQTGFEAEWQISYYGRNYPQQWVDKSSELYFKNLNSSLFGVAFVSLIDSYRNIERSTKYGMLFITLIFTAFFLFEVLSPIRIHPFQYTLIGTALCFFYLALLSLSELLSFFISYITASFSVIILISFYSFKILQTGFRTLIISSELVAIYTFLYIILQMQDYSLLFGTIGLFITLSAVMYFTRNIDWYKLDQEKV